MAIYSLDEIIGIIEKWEIDLQEFYKILRENTVDDSVVNVTNVLQVDQTRAIKLLDDLKISKQERLEYNKNLPDYKANSIMPDFQVTNMSSAKQLLEQVFDYEEELLKIYEHLRDIVAYEESKNLLEQLIQMKMGQLKRITSCLNSFTYT